jgi:uncharacterized protein YceK
MPLSQGNKDLIMKSMFRVMVILLLMIMMAGCASSPKNNFSGQNKSDSKEYETSFGRNWHEFWASPFGKLMLFGFTSRYPID